MEILKRATGEKILVMSDMGELGSFAAHYHEALGEQARQLGVKYVYAVGPWSQLTVKAFGEGGFHFGSQDQLITAVRAILDSTKVVLVKGSRSGQMEKVVNQLIENGEG